MILILLSWLLLIFIGIKYHKKPLPNPLNKNTTLALKGICAIEIMLGHIGLQTNSIILFANRKAGILFVGIFLALSGYGLMYSLCNKENYLNGFFKQRILKILLPAYLVYIIDILISQVPLTRIVDIENLFWSTNWYVWEIIVLYAIFYLLAKTLPQKYICPILFGLSTVFVIIAFILRIDIPWYGSTLCFPLGIYYYLYKDQLYEKVVKTNKYIIIITFSTIALFAGILVFFVLGESFIGYVVARNIASTAFVILVIFLLYRFTIGNPISSWLGKYSYEIFLFHFVYLKAFQAIDNQLLFALLVIVATIASAYVFATISTIIQKTTKRNNK